MLGTLILIVLSHFKDDIPITQKEKVYGVLSYFLPLNICSIFYSPLLENPTMADPLDPIEAIENLVNPADPADSRQQSKNVIALHSFYCLRDLGEFCLPGCKLPSLFQS